jgi:hypothetical protein
MAGGILESLSVSGMSLLLVFAPKHWWPWSAIAWIALFVFLIKALSAVGRRWRGRVRPEGLVGIAIGIAVVASYASEAFDSGDGDGGGGGD